MMSDSDYEITGPLEGVKHHQHFPKAQAWKAWMRQAIKWGWWVKNNGEWPTEEAVTEILREQIKDLPKLVRAKYSDPEKSQLELMASNRLATIKILEWLNTNVFPPQLPTPTTSIEEQLQAIIKKPAGRGKANDA